MKLRLLGVCAQARASNPYQNRVTEGRLQPEGGEETVIM